MSSRIRYRNSALINAAYKKMILPDVASRMCNIAVTMVNSFIAARFIGTEAMSVIALVVPIPLFSTCLFDLLGSGISQIIIKYKSCGKTDKAARAFGAITANIFFCYVPFSILALIFAKDILGLFTQNETLIAGGLQYLTPMLISEPFCIAGLCFERGFRTDGRNGFFGVRAIITNVLNVIFSLVAVLVFHGGIMSLSISACAATFLGYCWSFSHFFSSKCTIRPDFTVLKDIREVRMYVTEEIRIGYVFALDAGCYAAASALMNKAYIKTGGTESLAAIGIANSVFAAVYAVAGAIQLSFYSLSSLFYSDRDGSGCVRSFKTAVLMEAVFSVFAWLFLNLFSQQIGMLFNVDNILTMNALKSCFLFMTVVVIADCYTNLFGSFFMSTDHAGSASQYVLIFNAMLAICALIGLSGIDFRTLLCVNMTGLGLVALSEAILCHRYSKSMISETDTQIQMYSYKLEEDACAEISSTIEDLCRSIGPLSKIAEKAALLVEECNRLILYTNQERTDPILVDLRICVDGKDCVITVVDTGDIFDPIHRLKEGKLPEEFKYSRQILNGLSPKAYYARVANLNVSHLILPTSENKDLA